MFDLLEDTLIGGAIVGGVIGSYLLMMNMKNVRNN